MNGQIDMFQQQTAPNTVFQKSVVQDLPERKRRNKSQNGIIFDFLKAHIGVGYTAWQVKKATNMALITSTRRALTTLFKAGLIEKLNETTIAEQGEMNHYYRYR